MRGSYFVLVILRKLSPNEHNLLVNEKACVVLGKFHSFSLCGNPISKMTDFILFNGHQPVLQTAVFPFGHLSSYTSHLKINLTVSIHLLLQHIVFMRESKSQIDKLDLL